ncbi:MAG TPA: winged helix-turn-helix domain-containing protein [Pyrinomonadaceae bacterium]|nr:winged helix-turn-helix domain-containing protein [Pyrinomonadaceae bacterium]
MAASISKKYVLGDFSLEPDKRLLCRAGEPVHLPNRPYQVLLYLVENSNRVVSHDELLDRFWEGHDVYEDALRKAIGAIRKALNDSREQPRFIETRWAGGYRYIGPLAELDEAATAIEVERTRGFKVVVEEEIHDSEPVAAAAPVTATALSQRPLARLAIGAFLVAVIGLPAVLLIQRQRNLSTTAAAIGEPRPIHSIVVMPLKNLTGDPGREYFSDGLTESLIDELSRVHNLKVISRTSAFALKEQALDARQIGQRLGVEGILEGDVKINGDRARVETRLVSTSDGRVLWNSGVLERPLADVAEIQEAFACAVSTELRIHLCGEGEISKSKTKNSEAYEAYLKGRARWHNRSPDDMKQAIAYFEQALKLDPNYALAYAGLADTYAVMEVNGQVPAGTGTARAKEFAQKALAIDDSLAGPYAALGLVASISEWQWDESDRYFQQALARNPGYATAHHWYGYSLFARSRFAEAETELLRAAELDPLAFAVSNTLLGMYYYQGRYDKALEQARTNLKLVPDDTNAPYVTGLIYAAQGKTDEAVAELEKVRSTRADSVVAILLIQGKQTEALASLNQLSKSEFGNASPTLVAGWFARLNRRDFAFAWLQKSFAAHDVTLPFIRSNPDFASVRNDANFTTLVQRMGL